jgi:hypothetical protein
VSTEEFEEMLKKKKPVPSNLCDHVPCRRVNKYLAKLEFNCFGTLRNVFDREKNGFQKRLLIEVAFSIGSIQDGTLSMAHELNWQ